MFHIVAQTEAESVADFSASVPTASECNEKLKAIRDWSGRLGCKVHVFVRQDGGHASVYRFKAGQRIAA